METPRQRLAATIRAVITHKPRGFWAGFSLGILYFGYIFSWLWSAYPLSYFGITSPIVALGLIFLVFTVSITANALPWGIGAWVLTRNIKKLDPLHIPLVSAAIFTLAEYLRAWIYGIVWFGKGSALGPHWTLGNLAYLTHPVGLIASTASVWGIYGITFLLVFLVSAIILLAYRRTLLPHLSTQLATALVLILCAYAISVGVPNPSQPIRVAILQTKKPTFLVPSQVGALEDFRQKAKLMDEAIAMPDLQNGFIVMPEGSDFSTTLGNFLDTASLQTYFSRLADHQVTLLENIKVSAQDDASLRSRTVAINGEDGVVASYDKQLLTPIGEFLPYLVRAGIYPFRKSLPLIATMQELAPGQGSTPLTVGNTVVTALTCSDLASPALARQASQFIVGMESLGVFEGNQLIEAQMLALARMRAREQGKYVVLASNYGHSFIIDGHGGIQERTAEKGYQILTGDVVPKSTPTWYNLLGDWPILSLSLAILWYLRQSIFS
jgi:apolipoprotein N-acyltransferase